jgi:hypothetical protein
MKRAKSLYIDILSLRRISSSQVDGKDILKTIHPYIPDKIAERLAFGDG